MKKILIGRITVITSPENSSEFPTKGKRTRQVRYKIAVRLLVLLFCPIERKNRVFRAGERTPCTFRGIPQKDTLRRNEGQKKEERGSAPSFLPCAGNPQTRGLNFPPGLCPRSLESLLYLFPTLFLHTHQTRSSFVLWSWFISCGPWSSGIFSWLLSSPRGILSYELSFPSLPVCSLGVPLVYVSASLIILFISLEFLLFFFFIRFCFSFHHWLKARVILDVCKLDNPILIYYLRFDRNYSTKYPDKNRIVTCLKKLLSKKNITSLLAFSFRTLDEVDLDYFTLYFTELC